MAITVSLSPVVKYHGLARRFPMSLGFLMRPLLNGGTLGRRGMASEKPIFNLVRWIAATFVSLLGGGLVGLVCGLVLWALTQSPVLALTVAGPAGLMVALLLGRLVIKHLRVSLPPSGETTHSSSVVGRLAFGLGCVGALGAIVIGLPILETQAGLTSVSLGTFLLVLLLTAAQMKSSPDVGPK